MDHHQAYLQLYSLSLQCRSCQVFLPPNRMLIATQSLPNQSQYQGASSPPQVLETEDKLPPQSNTQAQQSTTGNSAPTQSSLLPLFCLTCFAKNKAPPASELHFQTYSQAAKRFIKQIPLCQFSIAEQCLKIMARIEQQALNICKEVAEAMDDFKFYILKLNKEVLKMCKGYEESLKFFTRLRIQERLLIDTQNEATTQREGIKKMFSLNQTESIVKLTRKLQELKLVSQKIPDIKLSMPTFNLPEIPRRKRTKVLDLPISSLINLRGQNYFGSADGRIIYTHLSDLVFHQAHDSLIRSFSHDEQYTLYSGSDDFSIKAWNTQNGKIECIKVFGMVGDSKSYHRNISVIQDGKLMVSSRGQFDNFRLRVWSLQDQCRNIGVLEGHSSFIRTMAVMDKEKSIIITGSEDRTIKIWHPRHVEPIRTIVRRKTPHNIIVNRKLQLCCIIEEDNRVSILDLLDFSLVTSMTLGRRILCSCGYSIGGSCLGQNSNDYIAICIPGSVGVWAWDCVKIWSFDLETAYTPINIMQVYDSLVASDGSGMIDEFFLGQLHHT